LGKIIYRELKKRIMKGLKVIVVFVGMLFFCIQNTDAQRKKITPIKLEKASIKSVTTSQLPAAVKKAASIYAGYKLKKSFVATSQQKGIKGKIYKVQIARGPIVYDLLINEKGKVLEMSE